MPPSSWSVVSTFFLSFFPQKSEIFYIWWRLLKRAFLPLHCNLFPGLHDDRIVFFPFMSLVNSCYVQSWCNQFSSFSLSTICTIFLVSEDRISWLPNSWLCLFEGNFSMTHHLEPLSFICIFWHVNLFSSFWIFRRILLFNHPRLQPSSTAAGLVLLPVKRCFRLEGSPSFLGVHENQCDYIYLVSCTPQVFVFMASVGLWLSTFLKLLKTGYFTLCFEKTACMRSVFRSGETMPIQTGVWWF